MSKLVRELSALEEGYLEDPLTTGLHVAAREGRTKTVAALLSFGADADAKDEAGRRALELAKDDATFEALKAGGATMYDMTQQKKNDLLLEYVKKGLAGGLLMALQAGADVNHKDEGGMTALALACVKVGNMEKLSWGGASADEAPPGLAVGRWVRATVTFTTNSKNAKEVSKGSLGKVASFDKNGNAARPWMRTPPSPGT